MNVEAPSAAWLGLAIPAILALWVLRPRRSRVRTPSLFLWQGAAVERHSARPWQRPRNHPLLWLQLLVALLLLGAALRPFLPAAAESRHVVVLVDASGSMRATDVAPTRFDVAMEEARALLESLGPGQRVSVIWVDEAPRILVADASPGDARRLLVSQEPGYAAPDLAAAFALAEGVAPGVAEWVLITDGALDIPADERLPGGVSLRALSVVADSGGNVAVTGLRVRASGDLVSVQAAVRNTGRGPASGELVLTAEDTLVGAQSWTLAPGAETYLTWAGLPPIGRWFEARLSGVAAETNALAHDDQALAGVEAIAERRVLLVSDGNVFLERVFSVLGGVRADRVVPGEWQNVLGSGVPYDVVVFDGVWPSEPPDSNVLLIGHAEAERFVPERIRADPAHPLVRHVDWSDVSIRGAAELPVDASWEAVVTAAGEPLLAAREEASRRQVALAFSLSESDLALRPAFPVLIANLLEWLAPRGAGAPLEVVPGESVRVEPLPLTESIRVEGPTGSLGELAPPWPPAAFRPPAPGLYRIVQEGAAGSQEQLVMAAGYSAAEAHLTPRPIAVEGVRTDSTGGVPGSARSLWPWLAVAVLGVSLAEWWWDARGR